MIALTGRQKMVRRLGRVICVGAAVIVVSFALGPPRAVAAGGEPIHIERHDWTFSGFFGLFDKQQLQRGFQVYQEVCAACHGLNRVYFRNLTEPGGPEFPTDGVKALAAEWPNQIPDGPNDEGEMFERPARLSDPIRGPFANDNAARAVNNGALPPDLSLITKSRAVGSHAPWYLHVFYMLGDMLTAYQESGADYVYALLTGYKEAPAGFTLAEGMSYNLAFPGHQIAMIQPIADDGSVDYQDGAGAKSSLKQNAEDVTAFLAWASDPKLATRKYIGWQVMLYLLVTTVLLYLGKKRIWSRVKH